MELLDYTTFAIGESKFSGVFCLDSHETQGSLCKAYWDVSIDANGKKLAFTFPTSYNPAKTPNFCQDISIYNLMSYILHAMLRFEQSYGFRSWCTLTAYKTDSYHALELYNVSSFMYHELRKIIGKEEMFEIMDEVQWRSNRIHSSANSCKEVG
jgi:hypothetical protein